MTVIRIVHNKENPYVQINKKALWNEDLSLKATGLWARCMSRPDNWRFSVKELISKCKEGRRAVDAAIKELIKNNYAVRLDCWRKSENGKFNTRVVEYVFFEFPATQEDKDKALEELKKGLCDCPFSDFRFSDFRKDDLLNTDLNQSSSSLRSEDSKKDCNKERGASPPDPDLGQAEACSQYFFHSIQKKKEDFNPPNRNKWVKVFQDMINKDKRLPSRIKEVIDYVVSDWKSIPYFLNPTAIRARFDELEIKCSLKDSKDNINDNRNYVKYIQNKYPDKVKGLSFDDKFVTNTLNCKDLPFDLPEKTFREGLMSLFLSDHHV